MGILSNSITATRYKIDGDLPENVVIEGIKKFRYQETDDPDTEYASGWTTEDKSFTPDMDNIFNIDGYIVFSLRIDKKSIPSSIVSKHVAIESERRIKESGKLVLLRAEKKEVKEMVLNMLSLKMPLKPEIHDVLIDLNDGLVTLFSASKEVCSEFETLFYKSFGVRILRLFPFTMAVHRTGAPDTQEMFFGSKRNIDASVAYERHRQLGSDFLTWLLYRIDSDILKNFGSMTKLIDLGDDIKITLENRPSTDNIETISIKNNSDNLHEVLPAISKGARVSQIRLRLNIDGFYWFFTLKDKDLSPASMKMPATDAQGEGRSGAILEKIALYRKAIESIEDAFRFFVEIWSDEGLRSAEVSEIERWAS